MCGSAAVAKVAICWPQALVRGGPQPRSTWRACLAPPSHWLKAAVWRRPPSLASLDGGDRARHWPAAWGRRHKDYDARSSCFLPRVLKCIFSGSRWMNNQGQRERKAARSPASWRYTTLTISLSLSPSFLQAASSSPRSPLTLQAQ